MQIKQKQLLNKQIREDLQSKINEKVKLTLINATWQRVVTGSPINASVFTGRSNDSNVTYDPATGNINVKENCYITMYCMVDYTARTEADIEFGLAINGGNADVCKKHMLADNRDQIIFITSFYADKNNTFNFFVNGTANDDINKMYMTLTDISI